MLKYTKLVSFKLSNELMPRTRKRHHSHSRSRSRSPSRDRSYEKHKKTDSHEKDGKRRRIESIDSPQKRSLSSLPLPEEIRPSLKEVASSNCPEVVAEIDLTEETQSPPKKPLTPKQLQKKVESEKKRQERQKEKEARLKEKQEKIEEKLKQKQQKEAEKQRQLEQKQKEKESKEEQKRKEKEEKETKRKEREEKEEQRRKEKEMEKIKKQQEIDEKNKEKLKEVEKKQKTVAAFVSFFKKPEQSQDDKKIDCSSLFKPFEVKSDMRLPSLRRTPLTASDLSYLDEVIQTRSESTISYLQDLQMGKIKPGKSFKTWPQEDADNDVTIIDDNLGETICEDTSEKQKHTLRAKFLYFHENRRPPYFGTWRKTSTTVKPRRPFGEDTNIFNYEEDSDDDWEEEEQGESIEDDSDVEADKETEDDYEVDNEFFVPHGHLSDDEVDDEETARLSPDSLKQKLKLMKDAFDAEMKSQTHKLKPRSIGCIWYNKKGDNVDPAVHRYLQPFAVIVRGPIEIKKRSEIFISTPEKKKNKFVQELPQEYAVVFLKLVHGNVNSKKILVEEFLASMTDKGAKVEISKASLLRFLRQAATYKGCSESGSTKKKFCWVVNEDFLKKYSME